MKLFVFDTDGEGQGIDLALRAQSADHEVQYFVSRADFGKGMLKRPGTWEEAMDWADLIVLTGNSVFGSSLVEYFGRGYPIFGANQKAAELELDREAGQKLLDEVGIETLPYKIITSPEEGVALIKKTGKPYVMKPWGGDGDKSLTSVPRDANEAIFTLTRWGKEGRFSGSLMMQEKADGIEMGIAGWFGPGGWSEAIEESFEHKKFLNDDLGENTGEMGTVIRHVTRSKLFDKMLAPLTEHLHRCQYVGDCSVNCIIDEAGTPWPLEFTMRLGWPDFCIRQEVIKSDPVEWMYDLLHGQDTLKVSTEVATGIVMTHGDYPKCKDPARTWSGYPIFGINSKNVEHLHLQQVMEAKAPVLEGDKLVQQEMTLTAGTYVLVAGGAGQTVTDSVDAAYKVADSVRWPSNVMYRTDIGQRLKKQLPKLQKLGYARGMRYE